MSTRLDERPGPIAAAGGAGGAPVTGAGARAHAPLGRLRAATRRLGLLAPLALLAAGACDSGAPAGGERGDRHVPAVETVQARRGALPLTQRLSGVVRARNQVGIYPEISAIITEIMAENGSAVREGDPLVRLRDTEFRERLKQAKANEAVAVAQLRRAEAQAKEAQAEYGRYRSLSEQELASQAELEAAEARSVSAEADVELARARVEQAGASTEEQEENLSQTVIRAPISGRVGNRNAEVGMLATPSTRLFTLGQLDSVRVEVVLTDRMLSYIETGQRAEIRAAGAAVSAPLSRISPFLNPVTHSTEAEIDLANPDGLLKPGMFVTVDIFYGESEEATLVPLAAIYEHPGTGNTGVYVTDAALDGQALGERGPESAALTDPVPFAFVQTEVIAQGRMEAAIRGVETDTWVVTLGQNLLGGENPTARVRPVTWDRVEHLQRLQREDLMEDIIERRSSQ